MTWEDDLIADGWVKDEREHPEIAGWHFDKVWHYTTPVALEYFEIVPYTIKGSEVTLYPGHCYKIRPGLYSTREIFVGIRNSSIMHDTKIFVVYSLGSHLMSDENVPRSTCVGSLSSLDMEDIRKVPQIFRTMRRVQPLEKYQEDPLHIIGPESNSLDLEEIGERQEGNSLF